ncbi:sortase-dependent protein [Streptomyces sp. NPDC002476]|uniref:sortase-dependent protein n=1 Tax=Streptomyces sp. NPDC002476 TaxID=3364648 RepID=UPI0036A0B6F3
MRHRSTLRTAVLAAVAAGAVLVPSTAAFADSPAPVASTTRKGTPENPVVIKDRSKHVRKINLGESSPNPVVIKDRSEPVRKINLGESSPAPRGTVPRGGVAAGERPVAASDHNTTVLAGSAAAALLVAGAGTFVLRRRAAAQPGR